ncbi:MotA/TolQ/ExbB proton channel family protein [Sphingomonas bacterium]|uniref:motility protein A n=1 Tax=Sphingomonas bacterium TaxID=1895847 RepID=UPI002602E075|nr:MotA/TolQ/ExbB proton channel family protein [Sphingomonas bacterium]
MQVATFLDPVALALVGGGTMLAALLRTPAHDLVRSVKALRTLPRHPFTAEPLLHQIAAQGRIAHRHGVMALDRSVITDPDVAAGLAAVVDGATPAGVAALLSHRSHKRMERHAAAADVWAAAAETAPAMGMIGTLIGLAAMFASMTDPAAIGGAMAVALLATLYGALLANLVALPIAHRLRAAARTEAFERARLAEPLAALAHREAPKSLSGTRIAA